MMTGKTTQVDLEKFVLGAIMEDSSTMIEVLNEDDFSTAETQKLYKVIRNRYDNGEPIDSVSIILCDEANEISMFVNAVSSTTLENYTVLMQKSGYLKKEVDRLIKWSDMRHIHKTCRDIQKDISSGDIEDVEMAIAELQLLQDTTTSRHRMKSDTMVGESMMAGFRQIERNLTAGRLKTTFPMLDEWMGGGIQQGEFVVIGARTNVGKSIISLHPVVDAARHNKWAMICSNEMTDGQMAMRMISHISQVEMGVIEKTYHGTSVQYQAIAKASEELKKLPVIMMPNCYKVSQIAAVLDRRKRAGIPVSLIILDYIQNMSSDNPRVNKQYDTMAEVTKGLFSLTKRYNCTIIAMSQVNRAGALADKILINHLEGAGAIEQTADKILLMYGDKVDRDVRWLELAKNRTGRIGGFPTRLIIDGARMTFKEQYKTEGV